MDLYSEPAVQVPTDKQLEEISEKLGLGLSASLPQYRDFIRDACAAFNVVDQMPEPTLPTKYPRTPGHRPSVLENKYNAWSWKCNIKGAVTGKLAGKTVAIKDNVAVAGIPLSYGTSILESYIPEFDATIVTKLLDAGATVSGKAACENMCVSGSSFTCHRGPVKNFHHPEHSAGGSSCGSATLVSSGEVDMAVGTDQGGSVRLPACWSGVVGLKPTFGLVPCTGSISIDPSLDCIGPLTKTVYDCAVMLEVLAGYDNGLDPRQHPNCEVPQYSRLMQVTDLRGVKIGILKEGFGSKSADAAVDRMVREVILKLQQVGAEVKEVSIPIHLMAPAIWNCIVYEGMATHGIEFGGGGTGFQGFYPTSLMTYASSCYKTKAQNFSPYLKVSTLMAHYMKDKYPARFYGKAQNLRRVIKDAYNKVLEESDIIAMPTIPFTATELPREGLAVREYLGRRRVGQDINVKAANLTGQPAMSVNVGYINGLPVGIQLHAKDFDEVTLFKVGYIIEKNVSS